jgi:hypothetical protein
MKKHYLSYAEYEARQEAKFQRKLQLVEKLNPKVNNYLAILFVFCVEAFLLVIAYNETPVDGGLITAIIIIAALPVLIMRAYDISALSLSKDGFNAQMDVDDILDDDEAPGIINKLYAQALSDSLYNILVALHDKIEEEQELNDKLRNQLLFLEYKGFIKPTNCLEDQNTTTSICSLFEITDLGKDFMKFRQDVLSN